MESQVSVLDFILASGLLLPGMLLVIGVSFAALVDACRSNNHSHAPELVEILPACGVAIFMLGLLVASVRCADILNRAVTTQGDFSTDLLASTIFACLVQIIPAVATAAVGTIICLIFWMISYAIWRHRRSKVQIA